MAVAGAGIVYVADTGNSAVRKLQTAGATLTIGAVVNGASNARAPLRRAKWWCWNRIRPGAAQLAQASLTSAGLLPTSLATTSVFFNGTPAPTIYTSATQVGAIAPFALNGATAQVAVLYQGQNSAPATVPIAATAPGLFTLTGSGTGQALAINVADNSLNGPAHPAKSGTYITLYATGAGQTNPAGSDGLPGASAGVPEPLPNATVTATIGGQTATVSYAGGAPNVVAGVIQVNVLIPGGLAAGAAPIVLQMGGSSTQSLVTIVVSGN